MLLSSFITRTDRAFLHECLKYFNKCIKRHHARVIGTGSKQLEDFCRAKRVYICNPRIISQCVWVLRLLTVGRQSVREEGKEVIERHVVHIANPLDDARCMLFGSSRRRCKRMHQEKYPSHGFQKTFEVEHTDGTTLINII